MFLGENALDCAERMRCLGVKKLVLMDAILEYNWFDVEEEGEEEKGQLKKLFRSALGSVRERAIHANDNIAQRESFDVVGQWSILYGFQIIGFCRTIEMGT